MPENRGNHETKYSRPCSERIVLTGFMGSGKSTIGRLLAHRLGWAFIDIDRQIETMYSASSFCLFQRVGEVAFRAIEVSVTAASLALPHTVVALGGAAVDHKANQDSLSSSYQGRVIFLDGEFEVLLSRCLEEEKTKPSTYRPLLHQRAKALTRFLSRREWNSAHADLRIDVSRQSCEQSLEEICEQLGL